MGVVWISGCFSGKSPLDVYTYEADPKNENLIVFVRGMGGTFNCLIENHACFEEEGFVAAVRRRGLPYDMVAPNTHFGYYRDRTLAERIRVDVVEPARDAGYRKIWMVGVSLGGLGALLYLMENPADIDGVLVLGPYLGDDAIIEEITAAGGLARWESGPYDSNEDWERMLWDWLKKHARGAAGTPPIYLGIANEDVYLTDHTLLAEYLPPERTITVDGKHRFSSFTEAWNVFLDRGLLK
jgi:alpha-beta hydrolase superfamily lysophospholipase